MSKLSRRSLVAGAASLSALAAGSAVASEAEPDPIFAAIERLKHAWGANAKACTATDEGHARFADKYGGDYPDAFSKELRAVFAEKFPDAGLHECRTGKHEQIDNLKGKGFDDVVEALHEELTRQTKAYDEIVRPLEDAQSHAEEALDNAVMAVLETPPTTMAGLAFVLAYAKDDPNLFSLFDCDLEYGQTFIATLATATAKLARVS
jgi:hypothetical protein